MSHDTRKHGKPGVGGTLTTVQQRAEPGKQTLTSRSAIQCRSLHNGDQPIHAAAERGVASPGGSLPHHAAVQASFGPAHDLAGVTAHVGGSAAEACDEMGAAAFATGAHVAFRSSPDLHTVAHEAAHVIQQRHGVQLYGGVGEIGDAYELNADAVADRVVAGESAADLLPASRGEQASGVQHVQAFGLPSFPGKAERDAISKGASVYFGMDDEGQAYAKQLMRHYATGNGALFNPEAALINYPTAGMWSGFLAERPEIRIKIARELRTQAVAVAGLGSAAQLDPEQTDARVLQQTTTNGGGTLVASGHRHTAITDVSLDRLESMRLTLHGCHQVLIDFDYAVREDESGTKTVTFSNLMFHWIDVATMHDGAAGKTVLKDDTIVEDKDMKAGGNNYPIDIPFAAPGVSRWSVTGGAATPEKTDWPSRGTSRNIAF